MNSDNSRRRRREELAIGGAVHSLEPDSLHQPLLHTQRSVGNVDEVDQNDKKENSSRANFFCYLITKWAKWFVEVVAKSSVWLVNMLLCGCAHQRGNADKLVTLDLSPLQEERLCKLQQRLEVTFDGTRLDHQETLRELWEAAFPERNLDSLITEQWKDMGWQGNDPSTDFRGGGFISLENLIFFAKRFPKSFQQLLCKKGGQRATWEYPFAVAGVNITFMLIQMLDVRSAKPTSWSGVNFVRILAEDEMAFDLLYCVAFSVMDAQWLAMRASYMEFNAVMKATRARLEHELAMESVNHIEDMPSFMLLR